jgi:predicted DNA-binding transcriptional regulator YafY
MRHEKAETILRLALDLQGTAEGLSLEDIRQRYTDPPLSRRTADRLKDAVERLFPMLERANPGELPKRWRLSGGSVNGLASVTTAELADLATAAALLRREQLHAQADHVERAAATLRALAKRPTLARIAPDLELLTEAEGLALRPGPRPRIDHEIVHALRHAILGARKVRLRYRYRGSGRRGFETVHPYGFLYGGRHYLVAWSENEAAQDFRNFALANIERVEPLDEPFERREGFTLRAYAAEGFGVFREAPVEVVWRFAPEAAPDARAFCFHPTQTMEEQDDGSLVVRFRAGGLDDMARHLFGWGDGVEVIAPVSLRRRLHEMACAVAEWTAEAHDRRQTKNQSTNP